jgi:glycosyltransferase involved in cell wall biosynthesis
MQSKRIKIFYIVPSLNIGGRERILLETVRRLDKEKFDIYLCSLKGKGSLFEQFRKECTEIKVFNMKPGIDFSLIKNLTKFFRERRPDIVHTHNPGPLTYGGISAFLAGIPVVVNTEHGFAYRERLRVRIVNCFLRNLIDMNICVSVELREKLKKYILNRKKSITIYNGIYIPPRENIEENQIAERRVALGFYPSDMIVGNVARLTEVKNHKLLLYAMKYVMSDIPRAKLLLVGDGPLRAELEDYARSINIDGRVIFWGEVENVKDLYEIMDVFVLSSNSEGISLTVLEAMAHGIPVVATDVGGNPEIIINDETGILVPRGDGEKLHKTVTGLLLNGEKAKRMGIKGKERVENRFNVSTMVKETELLYDKILNK